MTASPVFGKVYMASQLTDAFARKFYYLRLSITDVCNFRCTYCLPNGYKPGAVNNNGFLSVDEVRRVTRAFSALGTEKVRLTGGEPSLRRDFTEIIAAVRENPAIRQIAVTTNGYRLARDVERWRDAGLTAINVSVDSLDARQFHAITGQDKFHQVMDGIDAAFAKQAQVQFANGRDAQPIAGGAEVFFIRHDEADLAGVVRVTKDLRRAIAALADLMDPAAAQQFIAQHHAGEMMTAEQVAAFTGFHQLNKAQLDTTGLDPGEEGIELVMVNITHQHGIHLYLVKAGGEGGVDLRDLMAEDQQQAALEARIAEALTHKKQTHFLHQGNTGITQNLSYIGG